MKEEPMITIREERVEDHDSVGNINDLAFEASGEGRIVDTPTDLRGLVIIRSSIWRSNSGTYSLQPSSDRI